MNRAHFKVGQKGNKHPAWKGGASLNINKYARDYDRNLRKMAIESLGGKCIRCDFSDIRALQIDHINGGGSKERKDRDFIGNFHKHVINSFIKKDNIYQLLCANCNWIKRYENNEHK